MICVWWDWVGMVHWEMLVRNATVVKELYIVHLNIYTRLFGSKDLIDKAKPRQRQAPCRPNGQNSTPRARKGVSSASTVLSKTCTYRLTPFPLFFKPNEGSKPLMAKRILKYGSTTSSTTDRR